MFDVVTISFFDPAAVLPIKVSNMSLRRIPEPGNYKKSSPPDIFIKIKAYFSIRIIIHINSRIVFFHRYIHADNDTGLGCHHDYFIDTQSSFVHNLSLRN